MFNVIDVGTGGGFPGLPLAILLPNVQFTLVDSVKKKLIAVSDMASELDVGNVRVHHGRVEEMCHVNEDTTNNNINNNDTGGGRTEHGGRYDVVLGRSVTALPRFCSWVSNLMKQEATTSGSDSRSDSDSGGRLIYIIGGDIEECVSSRVIHDVPINTLLQQNDNSSTSSSDKRALVFKAKDVYEIAKQYHGIESREESTNRGTSRSSPTTTARQRNAGSGGGAGEGRNKPLAKGAWSKKQNDIKKQRGYDDFQRYEF